MVTAKKIEKGSRYYERLANQIAREYAPPIFPCEICGKPRLAPYKCTFCREEAQKREDSHD